VKNKLQQQNGYVLLFVLFFLSCTLLCSSVLVLNLSHQIQASSESVEKEQSRLLANSGWNLALEQLQLYGITDDIVRMQEHGVLSAQMRESENRTAAWEIVSTGSVGTYERTATGVVQCFALPFSQTTDWPVLDSIALQAQEGILLVEDSAYRLDTNCAYPLGITSANRMPLVVEVTDEIVAQQLYIYGDLYVSGTLMADALYVSGEIHGAEQIQCDNVYSGYANDIPYQTRVLERTAA
jgi:hypothetical protein